jgi:lipid-A-disaccharide synthase
MERYATFQRAQKSSASPPNLVLLPGSRRAELTRHLPVMAGALEKILKIFPVAHRVILPNQNLLALAQSIAGSSLNFQIGGLAEALDKADLAIASTGTVTLECAYFGVPTIAIYKTSWSTYQIGKRIIQVKFLAMPNLLANEPVFPEFIQEAASAEALAQESLEFLRNPARRTIVRTKLAKIIESLGGPGASNRAAQAILKLLPAN